MGSLHTAKNLNKTMQRQKKKKIPTLHLLMVGDSHVGKSCLMNRHCFGSFNHNHVTTIGIDYKLQRLKLKEIGEVQILIWDTAGQERFRTMTPSFFRRSHGVLITYDVTNLESFHSIRFWMETIGTYCVDGKKIKKILIGNKIDKKESRVVTKSMGQELANEFNIPFIETSGECLFSLFSIIYLLVHLFFLRTDIY